MRRLAVDRTRLRCLVNCFFNLSSPHTELCFRYNHPWWSDINVRGSSCKVSVIVSHFNQNPNSRTYFSKVPNMKFYDSSSGEDWACSSVQTERRNETNRLLFKVAVRSHHKDSGEGGEGEWNNRSGGEGRGENFFYISFFFNLPPVLLQTVSTLMSLIKGL